MIDITSYMGSNHLRKVLLGISLMFIVTSFTVIQWKEGLLLNGLHNLQSEKRVVILKNESSRFFDWDNVPVDKLMEYLKWPDQKACERVGYYGGVLIKYDNLSFYDGQKAICLDKGVAPQVNNCIVYSIGINNEWSFDDTMEKYGCNVYAFDPSMDVEEHNRTSKIQFYPIGLGARNEVIEGEQTSLVIFNRNKTNFKLMTLSSIYQMMSRAHGEEAIIDYLKIDIDWAEWNVIPEMIESGILDRVRQMGMEIHLTNATNEGRAELVKDVKLLKRLEDESGMVRFDSKMNALAMTMFKEMGNITGCYVYEMAWYNKKYHI